ncbi:hypothetical protein [Streptomyces sp. KR80]|uniref:hypothetical protein n=1 Tax=Streptomyces sp. KR80 TaxID=3457426 RepID=UPI003FD2BF26
MTKYGAWERHVRDLAEAVMGPSHEAPRRDVFQFLRAGEHGLAVETLADWIGEHGDVERVSQDDRRALLSLVSDFPEATRERVRRALCG